MKVSNFAEDAYYAEDWSPPSIEFEDLANKLIADFNPDNVLPVTQGVYLVFSGGVVDVELEEEGGELTATSRVDGELHFFAAEKDMPEKLVHFLSEVLT